MKLELEYAYWAALTSNLFRPKVPIVQYVPQYRQLPNRTLPVVSAWAGIESILADLLERFQIGTNSCLEFGVEFGYSTVALSSYFDSVIGIDLFHGDKHTTEKGDIFAATSDRLSPFNNIQLVRSDYRDWIHHNDEFYDLIHVDIVHTYTDTYACGVWSAMHSKCTLFHDTESFPAVKQAVRDIVRHTGKKFYNFEESNGLAILI